MPVMMDIKSLPDFARKPFPSYDMIQSSPTFSTAGETIVILVIFALFPIFADRSESAGISRTWRRMLAFKMQVCYGSRCPSGNPITKSCTGFPVTTEVVPVRIRYFDVPTPLVAGESALLSCHYELQGNETLYAVKWYKDMGEFFRYVPGADPKYKTLSQPGVDVDITRSNHREVFLRNLGLDSLGNYTCQVSTDRPYYRCVQTTRFLEVVVPPSDGPVLLMEPEKSEFELGDNVSIFCNSGRGKPAPDLMWYINGRPAVSDPDAREIVVYPDMMESSRLVLHFHLKPDIFKEGKLVLKCVAKLHQLQSTATKEILAGKQRLLLNYSTRQTQAYGLLVWLTSLSLLIYRSASQMLPA